MAAEMRILLRALGRRRLGASMRPRRMAAEMPAEAASSTAAAPASMRPRRMAAEIDPQRLADLVSAEALQ